MSTSSTAPDHAQQVAERISREFNERLCAFLARAIERRRAEEYRLRLEMSL